MRLHSRQGNIKKAAEVLRRMLREGTAVAIPPRRVEPAKKELAAPQGPKGLPKTSENSTGTVQHHYDGEFLTDPGVIDGVTGTGGGALIN